jgi:hypothetical protein
VLFVQLTDSPEALADRVILPSRAAHGKLAHPPPHSARCSTAGTSRHACRSSLT